MHMLSVLERESLMPTHQTPCWPFQTAGSTVDGFPSLLSSAPLQVSEFTLKLLSLKPECLSEVIICFLQLTFLFAIAVCDTGDIL